MSVVIETTLGDITVDLFLKERPRASLNFLKLCKMKFYNYNLFHTISRGFIAQTGDPTGSRVEGESIYGVLEGPLKRYFQSEKVPRIKHTHLGLLSFVGNEEGMIGSQFFITLGEDLTYLDEKHCVFGEVMEGLDVLELLNETICDNDNRPYQDVRITHTVVLDDPFPDLKNMRPPSRSPSPTAERLQGGRIAADEDIDDTEGKSAAEISEMLAEREAKARATILEMVGDLPDAEMAPPENVLFVCKLNPVTTDDDLEIIFSRFGKIKSCEVIRDRKSGDSLQYAFVEFEEQKSCEDAYFKMDNVLIDDRRIHVDFSQSVSKIKWHGKGRGVTTYDDEGRKIKDFRNDLGKGNYKSKKKFNNGKHENGRYKDGERKNVDGRRDERFQGRNNKDIHKFQRRDEREYLRNGRVNDRRRMGSPKGRRDASSEDDGRKNSSRENYQKERNTEYCRNKQRSPEVSRENRRHNEDSSSNRQRLYNDDGNRSKRGDRRRNEEFNSRNQQRSYDSRKSRRETFSDEENKQQQFSKKKRNYLSDEEDEQRRRKNRRENRQRGDSSEDDRKQNRRNIKEDSRRGYIDSRYKSGDRNKSYHSKSVIDYDRKKYEDYDRKKSYDDYARKNATEDYDRKKFFDADKMKSVDNTRKHKYSERDIKKTESSSSSSDSSSEDDKKRKKKKISSSSSSSSSEDSSEEDRKRKKKKKKKSRRKSGSSD